MPTDGPRVTALRPTGRGRTAVEIDGHRWRTFDNACIVDAGIATGEPLTRVRAAALARSRRRQRALATALRALEHRDRASADLGGALARRGIAGADRDAVVASLQSSGLVDDRRFASGRAAALAERGLGDAAIAADLRSSGVPRAMVDGAVDELECEKARVERIVARRGLSLKTLAYLGRRGFSEPALEALADALTDAGDRA